jgi:hypothetical protein
VLFALILMKEGVKNKAISATATHNTVARFQVRDDLNDTSMF